MIATPTATRPEAVSKILECLQREHCWGNGGCPHTKTCSGGGAENLDVRALLAYIEKLERRK